jgi:hypothetical protein
MDGSAQMNAATFAPARFFAPENMARIVADAQAVG